MSSAAMKKCIAIAHEVALLLARPQNATVAALVAPDCRYLLQQRPVGHHGAANKGGAEVSAATGSSDCHHLRRRSVARQIPQNHCTACSRTFACRRSAEQQAFFWHGITGASFCQRASETGGKRCSISAPARRPVVKRCTSTDVRAIAPARSTPTG